MYKFDNKCLSDKDMFFSLCQMARQVDSAVVIVNPKKGYSIDYVNHVFTRMTEYSEFEMTNAKLSILHGPLTDMLNEEAIQNSFENGLPFNTSSLYYRKDGSAFWNDVQTIPMRNQEGELQFCVLVMKDVTETMNIEALIELERDVYFNLENGTQLDDVLGDICKKVSSTFGKKCYCSIVFFNSIDQTISFYGQFAEQLTAMRQHLLSGNYSGEQLFLKQPIIIKDIQDSPFNDLYKQLLMENNIQSFWSQPILSTEGIVTGLFTMYFEQEAEPQAVDFKYLNRVAPIVTLAVKYVEQQNEIVRLAYYDEATGLINIEKFKRIMNRYVATGCEGHLYIIEPGEYQKIIELYGRHGGDEILRQIACRLQNLSMFEDSVIAKYTNSNLIVATRKTIEELNISQVEIDAILSEPYYVDNKEVYLTLKLGTSNFSAEVPFSKAILQADTALCHALKVTGTVIKKFDKQQVAIVQEEMNIFAQISKGLKNSEFFPVLQPKVNIQTGEIVGFEALARWNSPYIGFISPAQFIPVAENSGNIYKVDRQIFKKVLQWQKQRLQEGLTLYPVSVNISPRYFYNPTFVESSIELIRAFGIEPKYIIFEITESIELVNMRRAKKIINELHNYGIATSIDDFGVGYSSLGYLQELPFKEIKIDKSFVDNLAEPRMNAVIKTIVDLSHNLRMTTVAEGIETEEQHKELMRIGCITGQGYYYYKPMPIEEVNQLLATK